MWIFRAALLMWPQTVNKPIAHQQLDEWTKCGMSIQCNATQEKKN